MKSFFLALAVICAFVRPVSAADIETRLDESQTAPGETVTLSIRVSGGGDVEPGKPPRVDGLSISYRGNVTSYEYVNGRSWSGIVVQYSVTPERAGSFTIPAIPVKIDGKAVSSTPMKLVASGSAVSRRRGGFPGFPGFRHFPNFPDPDDEEDAASPPRQFVRGEVELSKRSVYAGEPVIVRYNAVTSAPLTLKGFSALPEARGFVKKDLDARSDTSLSAAGRKRVISYIAIPQTAGTLVLGGGQAVFSDDNGWGPFSRIPVDFPSVNLDVKPLPSQGRPSDFTGSVGSFAMKLDTEKISCSAFDERQITVTVSGTGNFSGMQPPMFRQLPSDVKVVPSTAAESTEAEQGGVRGEKRFVLSVVPEREGSYELGALSFSFFDASAGAYRTVSAGPVSLSVRGVSETKSDALPARKALPWIIVVLAVCGVAGLFASIIVYEKRKYALTDNAPENPAETVQEKPSDPRALIRLKYDLTLARERGDTSQFLSLAAKIMSHVTAERSDEARALTHELYSLRYGGKRYSKEEMAGLEARIFSIAE